MNAERQRVANLIREVFAGVTLGDGVGFWQAQGLDNYDDAKTIAAYRAKDEKDDWTRLRPADLNRCDSSLTYFDPPGMRFHLPAFLIAELEGTFTQDAAFNLTYFGQLGTSRFELLSQPQREAVRQFLLLRVAELSKYPECGPEREEIERALAEYWTASTSCP